MDVGRPPARLAMVGVRTVDAAIRDVDGNLRLRARLDERLVIALLASRRDDKLLGGPAARPPERAVGEVRHQSELVRGDA